MQLIEFLISGGYLLSVSGEYPVLKVTESGIAVLTGKKQVFKKEPKKVVQLSDEAADSLFEALRELRTDLASEAGVPPYVVFSDSTLKEMSQQRPQNRLAFLQIKGLIKNQKNSLCISQCKAFEEVVDTQMYGFSQQVNFAIRVGIVEKTEGQLLLSELERELNHLYSEVYQENYDKKEIGKEE